MYQTLGKHFSLMAFSLLLVLSGYGFADSPEISDSRLPSAQGIPPEHTLRLNVAPSGYPPYLIVNGDNYSGIVWDVVNLVAERMNFDVVGVQVPRKRVDNLLLEGFLDATPRAREWTANPEQFLFTEPLVDVEETFFSPAQSEFRYEGPESLHGKTLVTHLGYRYPTIEPLFTNGDSVRFDVSRDRDMFRYLLYSEDFEVAIADRLVGQWIILNEGMQGQFRMSDNNISQYGFRLMLRDDWQPFARAFNKHLSELKASGELEEILSRYR